MPDHELPDLAFADWLVLCAACERTVHGWALAALLGRDGELGRVWRVPRPVIYRILPRLAGLGLLHILDEERSARGPGRYPVEATPAGRQAAAAWLARPARHVRDIRSELMVKLALLYRAGASPDRLLSAQRAQLDPLAAAVQGRLAAADGHERTVLLWRHEAICAAQRFLDGITSGGPRADD